MPSTDPLAKAEANARYRAQNRQRCLAQQRAWCEANKERRASYMSEFHADNRERRLAAMKERYARLRALRLGTPAATSRGFGVVEFEEIGRMIGEVLDGLSRSNDGTNTAVEEAVGKRVLELCARFPIYR